MKLRMILILFFILSGCQKEKIVYVDSNPPSSGSSSSGNNQRNPDPLPPAPLLTSSILLSTDGKYRLQWARSSYATAYLLQEGDAGFANARTVFNGNAQFYDVEKQVNGNYYYRVNASNNTGTSGWSGIIKVTVNKPEKPLTPVIQNGPYFVSSTKTFTITWSGISSASYYDLFEDRNAAFSSPLLIQTREISYTTTKGNGTYYYKVRAYGQGGASAWSGTTQVVVSAPQ